MGFFGTLVLKSFFQNPDFLDFLWSGGGGRGGEGGIMMRHAPPSSHVCDFLYHHLYYQKGTKMLFTMNINGKNKYQL